MANKNIGVSARFLVQDAKAVPDVRSQSARNKLVLQLIQVSSHDDQGLRWWIAVAALPEGIDAADDWR
jgi:hypothetical protein